MEARVKGNFDEAEENGKTIISTNYTSGSMQEFDSQQKEQEFQEFERMTLDFEAKEASASYSTLDKEVVKDSSSQQEENSSIVSKERIKKMYPVGLVHGTYIIAENEDGMFIIDQHAANERINYEYYLQELANPKRVITDLLVPITLEFPMNEYLILKQNFALLDKIGFKYEEFGFQTIVIRALPVWLTKAKTEQAVRQIMDIIITQEDFQMEKFLHHIAATVACKASIKANDHIMQKDMEVLLERLRDCENPFTCPHGRPTIITYSKYDLEKLFKRSM